MDNRNIFVKIDTVFIFKVERENLIYLEDEYYIYKKISEFINEDYYVLFENNLNRDIISKFKISKVFKELIKNHHINNFNIVDFSLYVHSLEDEETIESIKKYENLENLYKDFIIHLNKFRKEQILKYTFNIKQRRISRKKLLEIKESMKKSVYVDWKYDDIF